MVASILFICGSLNAGKNGVGDYTRLLAAHLQTHGWRTYLLATHDHEADRTVTEKQREGDQELETLRIPRQLADRSRWTIIADHVTAIDPAIISLQFVPFSFDSRGFPRRFVQELTRPLYRSRQWHIMFHEMWVGHEGGLAPKRRLLEQGQKWLVKKLYRALQPVVVHSHLPAYIDDLIRIGIPARPLPLFANVATGGATAPATQAAAEGVFRLAFFSQMEISTPVARFIGELMHCLPLGKHPEMEVVLIGGNATKLATTRTELNKRFPGLRVVADGFLSSEALLSRLETVHLGITPVPLHALGKSGTVAAFLMKHVPVAAPKVTKQYRPFLFAEFNRAILTQFTPAEFAAARGAARDLPTEWIAPERVALNFMDDLQAFSPAPPQNLQKNSFRS